MSKKLYIIVALVFLYGSAYASADSSKVADENKIPYRFYYEDGTQIAPQYIEIIHQKDCCPDGWRYDNQEWRKMNTFPERPAHYKDPEHGSNGGISRA